MNQTMLGLRAACQPRFNLDDDAIDAIKKGNFSNEMNVKVFCIEIAIFPMPHSKCSFPFLVLCELCARNDEYGAKGEIEL